jgi:O6-methylguanine-DNA--protein-cysteine methyltransferase
MRNSERGTRVVRAETVMSGYTLFDTAIGACGIAWGERGVIGLWLPDTDRAALRRRIARRLPRAREAAPDAEVHAAIAAIADLFAGGRPDLSGVRLDMDGIPDFDRRVYEAARGVPPGETVTYGDLAARLGTAPRRARSAARCRATLSPSSSPATVCSPRAAATAVSRPRVACPRSSSCSRSRARGRPGSRRCSLKAA